MFIFKLLGAVCLGAASRILKSKIKETAAAVVVGIGLLVGSTAHVQAACDPPIFDVCFHKSSWSSSGYATLFVEFNGKSDQLYEFRWNGLKKLPGYGRNGLPGLTYDGFSQRGRSGYEASLEYSDFWWESWSPWNNYGVTIYEGHWDYSTYPETGVATWVRDRWVGSVDFYAYQAAAYVSIDNRSSVLDYELSSYYCTVDWESKSITLLHGYSEGYWEGPFPGGTYRYHGDPGSPRFHYRQSCSVTVRPPPRTSRNTRRPTPYCP